MLGALFGGASRRAEDIVFEPIDVPSQPAPARSRPVTDPTRVTPAKVETVPPAAGQASASRAVARGAVRRVAIGELMPRVPAAWRRSTEYIPEELIELPNEARLDVGVERALAFSLRYLAKVYPKWFRDPGPREPDPGVDLWMEPLRDPEAYLNEIPTQAVVEAEEERETFAEWEWDSPNQSQRETKKEARETDKILDAVRMPPLASRVAGGFDDLLGGSLDREEVAKSSKLGSAVPSGESVTKQAEAAASPQRPNRNAQPASKKQAAANPRLRKILEAYADANAMPELEVGVPAADVVAPKSTAVPPRSDPRPAAEALLPVAPAVSDLNEKLPGRWTQSVTAPASTKESPSVVESRSQAEITQRRGTDGALLYQTRFEELGLSLSRFIEVRGFGLWQGGLAQHTGDLGFDTRSTVTREKLERLLEGALSTQGPQDGFLSVTVHHATGGISVFGGGPCLVAVAHQAEGLPPHLRAWLCGWASQPLRS